MSKTSRRWRRVWLVRILPPVSAGNTKGGEKKSTLRRGDASVISTEPPTDQLHVVAKLRTPLLVSGHDAPHTAARHVPASSYFAASRTNRTSYLRNRPPTSWGRMGTVSTPTARPRGVSGAFA